MLITCVLNSPCKCNQGSWFGHSICPPLHIFCLHYLKKKRKIPEIVLEKLCYFFSLHSFDKYIKCQWKRSLDQKVISFHSDKYKITGTGWIFLKICQSVSPSYSMNVTYLWIRELVTFFRKVFVYSAQKVANRLNIGYYFKMEMA